MYSKRETEDMQEDEPVPFLASFGPALEDTFELSNEMSFGKKHQ